MLPSKMACSASVDMVDDSALKNLFQGEAVPLEIGGRRFYFLVEPHLSWHEFLCIFDERAITDGSLAGWKACRLCASIWDDISVLADANGDPVYLGRDPETYPLPVRQAIRAYQRAFRLSSVRDTVFFRPTDAVRHTGCNLGKKTAGRAADGLPYNHMFLHTGLNGNTEAHSQQLNSLLHQELPLLEQFLRDWNADVIKVILSRYETRGENAPGYKVNIGGLRFFSKLQDELQAQQDRRQRRITMLSHLLELFRGPHPADALGAIHIFSNGSNLAACRDAPSEEEFWAILKQRYEPTTYRQPTSVPTQGQVKAALKQVDGDLSCFERVHLSTHDPRVIARAIWRERPVAPRDATRISPEQLLAAARKTSAPAKTARATCFDSKSTSIGLPRRLTVDQFETWLGSLEPGATLYWNVTTCVYPIHVAVPVTEKGAEMIKLVEASWVLPGGGMTPSTAGIKQPAGAWLQIPMITPHVSRWSKDGSLAPRENAVVGDGTILQVAHTWDPQGSCLFAEFFRGEYHGMNHTRQELQRTLRMRKPADGEVFSGVLLTVRSRPGSTGLTSQFDTLQRFRVHHANGSIETVEVL